MRGAVVRLEKAARAAMRRAEMDRGRMHVLGAALALCLAALLALPAPGRANPPQALQRLAAAYPGWFTVNEAGLTWADGESMAYDDGLGEKDFEAMMAAPDLEEQLRQPYPAGASYALPAPGQDPGRARNMAFFKKMYGATEAEVRSHLRTIRWLPHSADVPLEVTTVNGVAERLEAVSAAIEALPPALQACAQHPAGTFCWRPIAATTRLSPHSFGIAMDLDVAWSHYWLWDLRGEQHAMRYTNRIPLEIVQIFERHGFIWGGKWHHYDTMHFEYRPELLPEVPPQAFSAMN